jgi:hypothetical protein
MAMSILTPETVLLVCEELRYRDIQALMPTTESNTNLIRTYEQTIAKAKIGRLVSVPQFQPLDRPVISSLDKKRTVLGPTNFEVVQELELRESMFRRLLKAEEGTTVARLLDPIQIDGQDAERESLVRFLVRFKETLQLMDRIMDCEATIRYEFALDPTPLYLGFDKTGLDRVIHRARQNLIAALSPLDLAFLRLVTKIFDGSTELRLPRGNDPIPMGPYKEEMLLQSGTMGVFLFIDDAGLAFVTAAGLTELAVTTSRKDWDWDKGKKSEAPDWSLTGALEPLKYVVRRTFAKKLGSLPKEHIEALENDEEDEVAQTGGNLKATPEFWLIARWILTQDPTLEERPPIPQESWKELFAWAVTQEPPHKEGSDDSD